MAWRSPTPMKREWQSVISPSLNISVYNIWQQQQIKVMGKRLLEPRPLLYFIEINNE